MTKCQNCRSKAKYLIGSLRCELAGLPKWLWLCDSCERKVADENAQINISATLAHMTVAEYVERHKEVSNA